MGTFARAYFSFLQLNDRAAHPAYNEWHQLEHIPENKLLPGVLWGERFVRSPACAAVSRGTDSGLALTDYVTLYLFRQPVEPAMADFLDLGSYALQTGSRPEVGWAGNHEGGFFVSVRGYVSPGIRVAVDALPLRPSAGIYIAVRDIDPSPDINDVFEHIDRRVIPDAVTRPGVAGAWTFVDVDSYVPFPSEGTTRRITVYFLDEDPLECMAELETVESDLDRQFPQSRLAFTSPLLSIVPREWTWFE